MRGHVEALEERQFLSMSVGAAAISPGPPTVRLVARPVVGRGTAFDFKLVFSSAAGMDLATAGDDVLVELPSTNTVETTLRSARLVARGTRLVAKYRMNAPGGVFDTTDNGDYRVFLKMDAVTDRSGAAPEGGNLGRFTVASRRVLP